MVHSPADGHKKQQTIPQRQVAQLAVEGDGVPLDQFHDKIGTPVLGHAGIQHGGDIRVFHAGQHLALLLEAGQHLPAVHPQFDHLERHFPFHRPGLQRLPNHAETALPQLGHQLVGTEHIPRFILPGLAGHQDILQQGLDGPVCQLGRRGSSGTHEKRHTMA